MSVPKRGSCESRESRKWWIESSFVDPVQLQFSSYYDPNLPINSRIQLDDTWPCHLLSYNLLLRAGVDCGWHQILILLLSTCLCVHLRLTFVVLFYSLTPCIASPLLWESTRTHENGHLQGPLMFVGLLTTNFDIARYLQAFEALRIYNCEYWRGMEQRYYTSLLIVAHIQELGISCRRFVQLDALLLCTKPISILLSHTWERFLSSSLSYAHSSGSNISLK